MSKLRPADLTQPITGLWPFLSGYQLWAGNCVDADPKLDRTPAVGVQPDFTTVAQVDLAPIHVTGAPDGSIVKAVHVSALPDGSDTSCPGGDTITLGVITGGQLNTSAPYGEWKLTAGTLSVPIAQVSDPFTLVSGDPPKDAVLR